MYQLITSWGKEVQGYLFLSVSDLKDLMENSQYPQLFCLLEKNSMIKIVHLTKRLFVYSPFDISWLAG